jgi:hypothetical protein
VLTLICQASASRRDDSDLSDNVGDYTEGQLGIFHVKMAADRMVANEHWGVANLLRTVNIRGRFGDSTPFLVGRPSPLAGRLRNYLHVVQLGN